MIKKIYHGSKDIVKNPEYGKGKPYNDYGLGFYCTDNKGKQNGVDLKDIQAWLGHSDFATTANIYSHLDATSKTNSLSALEGVISL